MADLNLEISYQAILWQIFIFIIAAQVIYFFYLKPFLKIQDKKLNLSEHSLENSKQTKDQAFKINKGIEEKTQQSLLKIKEEEKKIIISFQENLEKKLLESKQKLELSKNQLNQDLEKEHHSEKSKMQNQVQEYSLYVLKKHFYY